MVLASSHKRSQHHRLSPSHWLVLNAFASFLRRLTVNSFFFSRGSSNTVHSVACPGSASGLASSTPGAVLCHPNLRSWARCYPRHHPCYCSFCCCAFPEAPPAAPPASASSSSVVRKFLYDATLVSVSAMSCFAPVEGFALAAVLSLILLVLSMSSCCPPTVADVVLRSFVLNRHFGFVVYLRLSHSPDEHHLLHSC